jgi:hypothetical protein
VPPLDALHTQQPAVPACAPRHAARNSHGTKIAGLIGAMPGNNIGIAGVAPNLRQMILKVSCVWLGWGFALGPGLPTAWVWQLGSCRVAWQVES